MRRNHIDEAGMVTAEFAVTIPAIVALLALILGGVNLAWSRSQACHLAAVYARAYAVGEAAPAGLSPGTHAVAISEDTQVVTARVSVPVALWPPVECEVSAWKEPMGGQ